MKKKIKTIFMGTPDFAVPTLKKLIESENIEIQAVFCQPDKAANRGKKIQQAPTKIIALEQQIPVYQPDKLSLELENIKELEPDLIIVIAYGKIIPQSILDIPKYGALNIHASLLPKYRGSSCLQAAILNGDEKTGVTIMKLDAKMDTGPILRQRELKLAGTETANDLHDTLSQMGADLLLETIADYLNKKLQPIAQDDSQATYVSLIKKEDAKLDPKLDAETLERKVRAYYPWPGTYLELSNGEKLKILAAKLRIRENKKTEGGQDNLHIGSFHLENKDLFLKCGQNDLHILKLQRENRNALSASEFLKGNSDILELKAK
ncbi:MAG: methionyl-tRNA formyltransferase [Clostridia bacterium]|nr:methionyl-tRNA formyltransferase [Clostridia bacterium]